MSKRYVLFLSDSDLDGHDFEAVARIKTSKCRDVKVIPVKENPRAVVVRTTSVDARGLRSGALGMAVGERRLVSISTSGAIGNLKKLALESAAPGRRHVKGRPQAT